MTQRPLFASLLLLSTALVAPPALAQDSDAPAADSPAAPQDEEQGDVSIPGGVDQEIVVTGRFTPNAVRATPEVVSVLSSADIARTGERSEEHTSELQSLMRISYAVFCLKKKKNKQEQAHTKQKN